MLLIHDAAKVENTEKDMRLQSLLVQLSKTAANFSSTKETKLEKKSHFLKTTHHLSGFEEHLKLNVMWQQPPGHQFKNDKEYCCNAVGTIGNWWIIMKKSIYVCKTTWRAWLGLQGVGDTEQGDSLQTSDIVFSSDVQFNILLSLLFNITTNYAV